MVYGWLGGILVMSDLNIVFQHWRLGAFFAAGRPSLQELVPRRFYLTPTRLPISSIHFEQQLLGGPSQITDATHHHYHLSTALFVGPMTLSEC